MSMRAYPCRRAGHNSGNIYPIMQKYEKKPNNALPLLKKSPLRHLFCCHLLLPGS